MSLPDDYPSLGSVSARLKMLEHQSHVILVLSAINMVANLLTILVAVAAAWR